MEYTFRSKYIHNETAVSLLDRVQVVKNNKSFRSGKILKSISLYNLHLNYNN